MTVQIFFIGFGLFAGICFLFLWNSWQDKKINKIQKELQSYELNVAKVINKNLGDLIHSLNNFSHDDFIDDDDDEQTMELLKNLFIDAIKKQPPL